jgi:two-component system cell cycle sensor histidine kinase/response regulator CckA
MRVNPPDYNSPPTILVIEDESNVRTYIRQVLTQHNYLVLTAADGVEGLAEFEKHKDQIKLVLLDLTMPGLDGRELITRLRGLGSTVPILIMSGYCQGDLPSATGDLGVTGFLSKPFRPGELLVQVAKALSATPAAAP